MKLKNKKIAFGLTSSFYTYKATINEIKKITSEGGEVFPIMSVGAYTTDSKYGKAKDFIKKIEDITNNKIINTMQEAEEVDSDILVIAPCSRKQYRKNCIFHIRYTCSSCSKNVFKKKYASTSWNCDKRWT